MNLTSKLLALTVAVAIAGAALAQAPQGPGPGPGMMGQGAGPGMMSGYGPGGQRGYGPGPQGGYGPGMMGGYGPGYGMGPGMMGGYGPGYGMGPGMMGGYGPGYGMGPGMMGGYGMGALYMLDLNDVQRSKVNEISDGLRKKNWQILGQVQDEQAKLRDLYLGTEQPDRSAILAAYKRLFDLRLQRVEAMLDARTELERILTKEQRDALRSWRPWGMMGVTR